MVGRQFLAIVKTVKEQNCISVIEVLSVQEEIYFNEDIFFKEMEQEKHSPASMINSQSKYLSFLVIDLDNDGKVIRIPEYDLLNDVTNSSIKEVEELKTKCYSNIEKQIDMMNEVDSDAEAIQKDIDIHIHNLVSLGYVGREIKERLQEFVDEKYPDCNLKINLKDE